MGQLWLRSEVDNLEYKMKYSSRKKKLPTCIVVDTDALIKYSLIIKKLVNSTRFIVVVPAIGVYLLIIRMKLLKYFFISFLFASDIGTWWTKEIK